MNPAVGAFTAQRPGWTVDPVLERTTCANKYSRKPLGKPTRLPLRLPERESDHRLARAISDAGWAEFSRQLGYKQDWRGGALL